MCDLERPHADAYTHWQGSSAIQTVAALHPRVAHMTTYVRGQTWLSVPFAGNIVARLLGRPPPADGVFAAEESTYFPGFCAERHAC